MQNKRDTKGILSFFLAILGLIWGFMFAFGPIAALALGVISFILGFLSRRERGMVALNFGGMLFGVISVLLGILTLIYNQVYVAYL